MLEKVLESVPVAYVGPGAVQHPEDELPQVNRQGFHGREGVLTVEGVVGEKAALLLCKTPIFHASPESKQSGEVQENHQLKTKKGNKSIEWLF